MKASKLPRPFLKWAGGKTSSVPLILSRMPKRIDTYYEPFFGGGAVFFALVRAGRIKKAVISDTNRELIETLWAIRERVEIVIGELRKFERSVTAETYKAVRVSKPGGIYGVAARMIFLNRTCYNGLYRVNKEGKFNAPWGKIDRFSIDVENLEAVSKALQGVQILCQPYQSVVDDAAKGDVVYFDPPYFQTSSTSNFTTYTKLGFALADQMRLAATFSELTAQRVTVLASNADVSAARALYGTIPGVETIETKNRRSINCKGEKRGRVGELLFVANGVKGVR